MTVKLAEKASYQKNIHKNKLKYFAPKLISLYLSNRGYTHIVISLISISFNPNRLIE